MTITESGLYHYRKTEPAQAKWSWAQTMIFILITCGVFWAAVIGLVLSLI